MTRTAATTVIRTVASLAMLAGVTLLVLVIGIRLPPVFRYSVSSGVLLAIPFLCFAGYTIYLGYTLFSRVSRRAFERIWFCAVIFIAVIIGRRVPFLAALACAALLGLSSRLLRPLVSNSLFPKDDHV
jgi:hypothetical protein